MPQYGCFLIFLQIYLATVLGGERECTTDSGGGSTPPTDNVPEEKPKNFCTAGTIEPILTTALSGQLNIDRTQYPGIDDHKPWDRGRVSAWRSGMGVHWKKNPSGYRNGTDAGTRDTSIPLEHPDAQEAVDWSLDQWEAWNENRQAAGLPRMHIYERKCDRTTLTELQVYEMYREPRGSPATWAISCTKRTIGRTKASGSSSCVAWT